MDTNPVPSQVTLLVISLIVCAIIETECTTYHVSFLGRSMSALQSSTTGSFFIKTTGNLPAIQNSVSGSCQYNVSDWGLTSGFQSIMFDSPDCLNLIPNGTELATKGIRFESPDNFTLHVVQSDSAGQPGDGYLAIPDEHLGNEYYVITYCSTGGICQFAVAAIADNTSVEITFPDNTDIGLVCADGIPLPSNQSPVTTIPFTLNEFDILHFESEQDLSGTYIYASNEIAVFVGARGIPKGNGSTSEVIEQIPPVNKWGYEFVVVPNYLNDVGDIVKLVTKDVNTVISILGYSPFTVTNAGDSVERRIDWQSHTTIHSSKPVLLFQIMSVNLYNSNSTTGSAAMVLVQHREQWIETDNYFYCLVSSSNNGSLIAVVSEPETFSQVSVVPKPALYYSPWNAIDGSYYEAMIFKPAVNETLITGAFVSTYGYCEGKYAMLLEASWEWENEGCLTTASSPGDDVDNDCDGLIDEDNCTRADLKTNFTSVQNSSGHTSYKTFNVRRAGHVNVTVTTCDIAMLKLIANNDEMTFITVQISPSMIVEQICMSNCFSATSYPITVVDCTIGQQYSIEWFQDNVGLKHRFRTTSEMFSWDIDNSLGVIYDELVISTLVGTTQFLVGLSEKDDCGKVISELADTAGVKFVIPVRDTDDGFTVFINTEHHANTDVKIYLDVEHLLGQIFIGASETFEITKGDIIELLYTRITLTAVGGEVTVYLQRTTYTEAFGLVILPVDVLGPSYHFFSNSSIDKTNGELCNVFAVDRTAFFEDLEFPLNSYTEIAAADFGPVLVADRPLAVFCGTLDESRLQMPPKETLGEEFYIPKLNLELLEAEAEINIVMAEDSTVVTIKGDYDQMDPVHFTGDAYFRNIVSNTIYSISATKPVQVHLHIWSSLNIWSSAVVIPPIEQYKSLHVFPGLDPINYTFIYSSAVSVNGTNVESQVTQAAIIKNMATTFVYNEGPVFSLTVVDTLGKRLIIPSDVQYQDINQVCVLTVGSPGDGIDNDCDGLVDEEICLDVKGPGTFDFDLDGALNEDCSNASNATVPVIKVSIPIEIVTCQPNETNVQDISKGGIVIDITDGVSVENGSIIVPSISGETGSLPSYETLTPSGGTPLLPTTTPPPGSTAPPEETCVTDCVCPCGWVNPPQNYTAEELATIIHEIQEKLIISKTSLSSTIRKKTSASDDRPSATAVGYVGLASMIVSLSLVALLDITTLLRDLRMLADNVRNVFQQ